MMSGGTTESSVGEDGSDVMTWRRRRGEGRRASREEMSRDSDGRCCARLWLAAQVFAVENDMKIVREMTVVVQNHTI